MELITKMTAYELDEIHRIRRGISARFNHDTDKLVLNTEHLMKNSGRQGANLQIYRQRNQNPGKRQMKKLQINIVHQNQNTIANSIELI